MPGWGLHRCLLWFCLVHLAFDCQIGKPTTEFHSPGDYIIAGAFPVHNGKPMATSRPEVHICQSTGSFDTHGYHLFQAMRFTIEEINNSSTLLPNISVGFEIFDTCSESAGIFATLNILTQCTGPYVTIENSFVRYQPRAMALIGPDSSNLAFTTASMLSNFLMPQISYEATSESLALKNFYPSFLRTIPSDEVQVKAILHLLKRFRWSWIAVVASDNDYGRQGLQNLYRLSLKNGFCVAYQGVILDNGKDNRPELAQMLRQINQARVQTVVVYSTRRLAKRFFQVTVQENITDKVWLATEDWAGWASITSIPNIQTIGSVIGVSIKNAAQIALKEFEAAYVKSSKVKGQPLEDGGTCNQVCEECQAFVLGNMAEPNTFDLDAAFNVYSAVYAVAYGLHDLLNCGLGKCKKDTVYPWQLLEKIKKVNFLLHNRLITFDDKGEPASGYDLVMWNWTSTEVSIRVIGSYLQRPPTLTIDEKYLQWHTKDNTVPISECSRECMPGQKRESIGAHLCCFNCVDCPRMTIVNRSDLYSCQPCGRDQWSPPSSAICFNRTLEYLSWTDPVSMVLLAATTAQLFIILTIAVIFILNLNTPVVKSAGGLRCQVMLVSLACACASLYLYFGAPTAMTCLLRQPLFAVSFTVCFSCIVVRSFQIVCIFKLASKAPRLHDFWVKKNGPNIFIVVSSIIQLFITVLWVSTNPPQPVADYQKYDDQILLECSESSSVGSVLEIIYIGLLSVFCFIFCYMGKDLPANYNEAKCITFSLLVYFISWISFFTVYIIYMGKYITAANVLAILCSLFGIISGYFLPKCYVILFRRELNTTEHFQSSIQNYTKKRSSD